MLYRIERDDDGYPPVDVEALWVRPTELGTVILDNIPFYARDIAPGDELEVVDGIGGDIWFDRLVRNAGASVFRVSAAINELDEIRRELRVLGVSCEVDRSAGLLAVEISSGTDISPVLDYLMSGQECERFDFEEAALRHAVPE